MACLHVTERGTEERPAFAARGFEATVTEEGLTVEAGNVSLKTRGVMFEQGAVLVPLAPGPVSRPAFGCARIDRGVVFEDYVVENSRVEQLFRIPRAFGSGPLRLKVSMETPLSAYVERTPQPGRRWGGAEETRKGLAFGPRGGPRVWYYGAVAIDAVGRTRELEPSWENGLIALEVPEDFLARAEYPVTVDPWIELDGSASGGGVSGIIVGGVSVALDASGYPVAAWIHSDPDNGDNETYLKRWNGLAWVELGGSASNGGISNNTTSGPEAHVSLALDESGYPVVAWIDTDPANFDDETYLKRWDGTAWVELDGSASNGGLSDNATSIPGTGVSLAVDASGNPVVAWIDRDPVNNDDDIYLKKWNGAAWVELAGSASDGGLSNNATSSVYLFIEDAGSVSLALDGAGNPVVAWIDADPVNGDAETYLKRWNGLAWVELDGSASNGGLSANTTTGGCNAAVALDGSGNPVVAWLDSDPVNADDETYVKRWNGSAWVELAGSASGGGVSNNATAPGGFFFRQGVSVAVEASGNPVVAWFDGDSVGGDDEVYLKRWNGSAWVELGGSASGGGVSDNATSLDTTVSLALDAAGNPVVAWVDFGNRNVYLKYWFGSPRSVDQLRTTDLASLAVGQLTDEGSITFRAVVGSPLFGSTAKLQIELRAVSDPLTGSMTTESLPTAGGTVATVSVSGLAAGQYHWQARMVSGSAPVGEWTPFGGNANGAADFEIVDSPVAYSAAASPAVVQDGDLVSVTIVADAAGYSVTADFLGLDSAYTPGDETVTPGPPGTYVVTYTISAGNTRADGPYLIPITVTRAPGIDVAATASFQLDNTPPAAPAITAPTAGATVTGQTLTISGTAPAGTSVAVTSDVDGVVGIATASPAGDWSMASTLSVGSHSLTATATEDSGLVSATSTAVGVTIQSVRPLTVVKKSEKCGATGLEALLIVMLLRLARGKGHRRRRSGKMPGPWILKEVDL